MVTTLRSTPTTLGNIDALRKSVEESPFDAVVAVSPDNFPYASGCFVWTQTDLRERLAMAVWCWMNPPPMLPT